MGIPHFFWCNLPLHHNARITSTNIQFSYNFLTSQSPSIWWHLPTSIIFSRTDPETHLATHHHHHTTGESAVFSSTVHVRTVKYNRSWFFRKYRLSHEQKMSLLSLVYAWNITYNEVEVIFSVFVCFRKLPAVAVDSAVVPVVDLAVELEVDSAVVLEVVLEEVSQK